MSRFLIRLLLLSLCFSFTHWVHANEPAIQLSILNGDSSITIDEIRSPSTQWIDSDSIEIKGSPEKLWWRLQLTIPSDDVRMLSFLETFHTTVVVYAAPDYRGLRMNVFDPHLQQLGSRQRLSLRLSPIAQQQPIYIQLEQPRSTPIRMQVETESAFFVTDRTWVRFNAIVQFGLILLALVAAGQAVAVRYWSAILLAAWCLCVSLYFMANTGDIEHLFAGDWWLVNSPMVTYLAPMFGSILIFAFVARFIGLKDHMPWTNRLLNLMLGVMAILFVIVLWLGQPLPWIGITANAVLLACQFMVLVSGIWLAFKGHRNAVFYLLSWAPLGVLTMIRIVGLIGSTPTPAWMDYAFPLAMLATGMMMILMLAIQSRSRENERLIAHQRAHSDALTGVLNRLALEQRMQDSFKNSSASLALLFFDLDHFKSVNDTYGHEIGDATLKAFAQTVQAEIRVHDCFARLGGEEFVLLVEGADMGYATRFAERLRQIVQNKCAVIAGHPIALTVSIGVAVRDAKTKSPADLLRHADAAAYRAKQSGRNRVVQFGDFSSLKSTQPESNHVPLL